MDTVSSNIIDVFEFLLPGFLAAWIFYSLTSYSRPSQFERVIQALIFTLFIQSLSAMIRVISEDAFNQHGWLTWDDNIKLIVTTAFSIIVGLAFSAFANNDQFHYILRNLKITRETSYPSEWFGSFLKNVTFVALHLKDERRIYGWPTEWPSAPTSGHFLLTEPTWLLEDGSEYRLTGVSNILIDVKDVLWVEFLEKTWEKDDG